MCSLDFTAGAFIASSMALPAVLVGRSTPRAGSTTPSLAAPLHAIYTRRSSLAALLRIVRPRNIKFHGRGKVQTRMACSVRWALRVRFRFASFVVRAGVVQWQYRSFPSFGRGFDSHRPLHNLRCLHWAYPANLLEFTAKTDRFASSWPPSLLNGTPTI